MGRWDSPDVQPRERRALAVVLALVGAWSLACASVVEDLVEDTDILQAYPVDWTDWDVAEPDHPRIASALGGSLYVGYCDEHFPAGTVGHANLETALERVAELEGVDIEVSWVARPDHPVFDPDFYDLYTPTGVPYDIYFDYVDDTPFGRAMGANGGVYTYFAGTDEWRTARCPTSGCEADAAIVAAQLSAFSTHAADATEEADAPPLGLWSHEVGHMLGIRHQGEDDGSGRVRDLDRQHFHSMTVWRGQSGLATHATDVRTGRVSAYSKAYIQARYADPAYSGDTAPDWFVHETLLFRDTSASGDPSPVTPDTTDKFGDYNPSSLLWDDVEGIFVDCDTAMVPRYFTQFSNVSDHGCGSDVVEVAWQLDGVELERRSVDATDCAAPYVQYQWARSLRIEAADVTPSGCSDTSPTWVDDASCFPQEVEVAAVVDPDGAFAEAHEDDNAVAMAVELVETCP